MLARSSAASLGVLCPRPAVVAFPKPRAQCLGQNIAADASVYRLVDARGLFYAHRVPRQGIYAAGRSQLAGARAASTDIVSADVVGGLAAETIGRRLGEADAQAAAGSASGADKDASKISGARAKARDADVFGRNKKAVSSFALMHRCFFAPSTPMLGPIATACHVDALMGFRW